MEKNEKSQVGYNRIMIAIFIGIIIVPVFYVLVTGQKEISQRENRRLTQVPTYTMAGFLEGQYQETMESALKDQLPGSKEMKLLYNTLKRQVTQKVYYVLEPFSQPASQVVVADDEKVAPEEGLDLSVGSDDKDETQDGADMDPSQDHTVDAVSDDISHWSYSLLPMGNDVLKITETNTLIMPSNTKDQWQAVLDRKIDNINGWVAKHPELAFYVYYIETDHDVNLIDGVNDHAIRDYYFEGLDPSVETASQSVNDLSDLTDKFFKTDHHWNMTGQYEGYKNITRLLGEVPDDRVEVVTLDGVGYIGSKAKKIDDFTYQDTFGYLINRSLQYTTYVNDVLGQVNQKANYDSGYYSMEDGVNHYAICYGYDVALLTYDFDQPEKDDLLIFAASFSNPINELIASHFNKTYVVDLRHFQRDYGQAFDFEDFLSKHPVDRVLFTGYYSFHVNDVFLVE